MENAYKLAKTVVGQTLDVDGVYGGQCVDLVNWIAQQYGTFLWGNGNQIGIANDVSAFADVIPWREGFPLQTGDIIAQDVPSHGYGHVVVFGEGTYDNALVIEQNYNFVQVVVEQRRSLRSEIPLRVVRFRNQDNYTADSGSADNKSVTKKSSPNGVTQKAGVQGNLYEVTCDIVDGIKGNGDNTVIDTFYKCNKIAGSLNGEWLIYRKFDNSVGYLPATCVKLVDKSGTENPKEQADYIAINEYNKVTKVALDDTSDEIDRVYSLGDLVTKTPISWGNLTWKYAFQSELPNNGNNVKGLGLSAHGFVVDGDGYIVLGFPVGYGHIEGTIYDTPFGFKGKAYYPLSDTQWFSVFIK